MRGTSVVASVRCRRGSVRTAVQPVTGRQADVLMLQDPGIRIIQDARISAGPGHQFL